MSATLTATKRPADTHQLSLQDVASLLRALPRRRAPDRLRRKLALIPRAEHSGR